MTPEGRGFSCAAALAACVTLACCGAAPAESDGELDLQLAPPPSIVTREGLAAAILIDVSGSMQDRVASGSGERVRKIEVARQAALGVVGQFASYAKDHRDEPVLLGIYEFSRREGQPDVRTLVRMAAPDLVNAVGALQQARPDGGTPIGSAIVSGKRDLDATGVTRRHLLVVTDGENTDGAEPERVVAAIGRRPEAERPSMYFVAFDIDADRFRALRNDGVLVFEAANGLELNNTLSALLRGKILVEQ